jgi:integrase
MKINLDYQSIKNSKQSGRHTTSEKGLQILIKPNGQKYWVIRYAFNLKRHDLALGSFPEISVAEVKKRLQEVRFKISQGISPIAERKSNEEALKQSKVSLIRFDQFALDTIEKKSIEWSNIKHSEQWETTLRKYAFPVIGHLTINQIELKHILEILTPIWKTKTETANRLRGRLEWILASATTLGLRSGMNPALWRGLLQTILPAPKKFQKVEHHKALPYKELPQFISTLKEIDSVSALALEFLILNANRTSEVTDALRTEIDEGLWTIPANRMKARVEHRVPLGIRSLEILNIANEKDSRSQYLFSRNGKKLSNMAMSMTVRRISKNLSIAEDITVHGFRSAFRDWVSEETLHSPEVAEMALAHTISNKVESAYRRGDLLERRRLLMADWETFISTGQLSSNVIKLKTA